MLIKEYHIPLPLTLEEYRIAQLYMIQKKSREESEGEGSAVEILENHPYTDGPNGSGQYTYKVYHIGRHLPSWFRGIAPKTALEVHEESWNAYPYTKTIFKVPFVEKFTLEIETYFVQDDGSQENFFKMSPAELRNRELDTIDIVNDELSGNDYKKEEDPSIYHAKTGRGPLQSDWITNPPQGTIMCAYKLVKVEFRYWGLQSKVERFIHDYGLRRVMVRAHRQAWAWQDEWVGLTITDIRRLERETQFILQKKLGRLPPDAVYEEEEVDSDPGEDSNQLADDELSLDSVDPLKSEATSSGPASPRGHPGLEGGRSSIDSTKSRRTRRHTRDRKQSDISTHSISRLSSATRTWSDPSVKNRGPDAKQADSDEEGSMYSVRHEWAFDQIAMESGDSDAEFFDAKETISSDEECKSSDSQKNDPDQSKDAGDLTVGSLEASSSSPKLSVIVEKPNKVPMLNMAGKAASLDYNTDDIGTPLIHEGSPGKPSTTADFLFLVFHGGSALDARKDQIGKDIDFQTLSSNFRSVIDLHFPSAIGRVALRMVPCVNVCSESLQLLSQVHPGVIAGQSESSCQSRQPESFLETLKDYPTHLPIGAVPLLATDHHGYPDCLATITATANKVYSEFLHSQEGDQFNGQVCVLADCMGSVVMYDILSSTHPLHSADTHTISLSPWQRPPSPTPQRKISFDNRHRIAELQPISACDSYSSLSSSNTSLNVGTGLSFDVSHFFVIGSPLGLVLGSRRSRNKRDFQDPPPSPYCSAFYNLFYDIDPFATRVEPLLDQRFSEICPISLPSYRQYPTGMAKTDSLLETVVQHPSLFGTKTLTPPQTRQVPLARNRSQSSECLTSHRITTAVSKDLKPFSVWWSQTEPQRMDYLLESPHGADKFNQLLPQAGFSHIIHSRYWEAKELVSFILRQVLRNDGVTLKGTVSGKELIPFLPLERTIPWSRKRTPIKLKHLSPNHGVCDVLTVDNGAPPTIVAKFQYGPLAMTSLSKEQVELYLLQQVPKPSWELYGTADTDSHGKASFTLPQEKRLPAGVYPVKCLVKGDHTTASCNLFVVPPHTEAVVFSVDGALASNFSLSARDMKVRTGAVNTARCWHKKGYLLIYITGRPLLQKEHIMSFLGAHNFPLGLVACAESLSPTDSQSFKTMYLARLIKEAKLIIHVAYGSQRHIAGFKDLGLQSNQIYIHGNRRSSKSTSCQYLYDGFTPHLSSLDPRPASFDTSEFVGDICFVLPGAAKNSEVKRMKKSSSASRYSGHHLSLSLESNKTVTLKGETVV